MNELTITFGHVIAGIVVIILYYLIRNILTFVTYSFEGEGWAGIKFLAYGVKLIIIGAMLFNMFPHYIELSKILPNITWDNMKVFVYTPLIIEILWLVGTYLGACLLELFIGAKMIFPMIQKRINSHKW